MRIAAFKEDSLVDGPGMRFVIVLSGCIHNCEGCHNPEFQDYNYGKDVTNEEIMAMIYKNKDWIKGITLSGGDPLFQLNATKEFLKIFKAEKEFKDLTVWMYTGYTFEDIPKGVTILCDTIVDGKYMKDLPPAKYRGSNNQRVMTKYLNTNKYILTIYEEDKNE